jgi:hypothetical protein
MGWSSLSRGRTMWVIDCTWKSQRKVLCVSVQGKTKDSSLDETAGIASLFIGLPEKVKTTWFWKPDLSSSPGIKKVPKDFLRDL